MWNDPELDILFIESLWADASNIDTPVLEALFASAHEVCIAYAPALAEGEAVPERYKQAEIMQAKHISGQFRGGDAELGPDGYVVQPYPLIFAAQSLLRPKQGKRLFH